MRVAAMPEASVTEDSHLRSWERDVDLRALATKVDAVAVPERKETRAYFSFLCGVSLSYGAHASPRRRIKRFRQTSFFHALST